MSFEWEISTEELENKIQEGCPLIDIRNAGNIAYGMIPGAIAISQEELSSHAEEWAQEKGVVIYCTRGLLSMEAAEELRELGVMAYSLKGGYMGWLMNQMEQEKNTDKQKEIEEGLRKTWKKRLFSPFARAVKKYELVKEGDKIAVCISGGKDSMLMAKLFQELQRHRQCQFDLVFLVMNPGYNEENRKVIEHNAKLLGIPITMFETNIFDIVYQEEKSPCYLCARMRRGYLYSKAQELGCNKIALGHHYDDVIETILMGMLHSGQIQTMMPKLHSTNFSGMELIRPMYLIREDDIKRWRDDNELNFIQCACHFTDTCSTCEPDGRTVSKRMETKLLIAELKKNNPYVESHIFKSVENVSLDTIIAYKKNGEKHHFLDSYDNKESV
ncbi:ATP-binding protein [Frisingicoccus sp.]|uniref:ATP-binding protein n=1 Tax=Frisingicoccus sp. TaxID=1918627 RepID=UPI002EB2861C|nr:ATP-binding protein [Frisingicoccus sp.]